MKKVSLILFTICQLSAFSQNCSTPVSNSFLSTIQNQILSAATTTLALQKGKDVAQNNCFTSVQAKDIISLFLQDVHKTEIAKLFYPNVIDNRNFWVVYEMYTNAPALASLNRFVSEYDLQQTSGTNSGLDKFNIVLPDYEKYTGIKILNQQPLNSNAFAQLLNTINNPEPQIRLRNALNTDPSKYFSVAQVMEIAMLFQNENMRQNVLQHYVAQTVDIHNYPFALQLLTTLANKIAYQQNVYSYLRNSGSVTNPNNGSAVCQTAVTNAEAMVMKNSLEKIKISSSRVKQYKAILRNKCVTTSQIKTLVLVFNNTDRLELLKYSYDYCSDVQNYYSLSDVLVYNTDIEAFSDFMLSK
jgi:Domain of unknown function (DUF4476)